MSAIGRWLRRVTNRVSPMGAKMVAKKYLGTVELSHQPRSTEDVNAMIGVLMLKVKQ